MTDLRKRRTKRNAVARALMEGYSQDHEQYRFALLSAEMALDAAEAWEHTNQGEQR